MQKRKSCKANLATKPAVELLIRAVTETIKDGAAIEQLLQALDQRVRTQPELVYAAKLQRLLGISDATLWRWRHDDRLGFPKARLINRRVYFPWQQVLAWLDRQQQVA